MVEFNEKNYELEEVLDIISNGYFSSINFQTDKLVVNNHVREFLCNKQINTKI